MNHGYSFHDWVLCIFRAFCANMDILLFFFSLSLLCANNPVTNSLLALKRIVKFPFETDHLSKVILQQLVCGPFTWLKSSCVPISLVELWKKDVTDVFSFVLGSHSRWWKASTEIFQFYFKCNYLKILGEGNLPVLNLVPSSLRHINIIYVWY